MRQNLIKNNYCWYYELICNDIYPIKTDGRRESFDSQSHTLSFVSYNYCSVSYEKNSSLKGISVLRNAQVKGLPNVNHWIKQKLYDPVQNRNDFQ